jgi:hypothetical protein
VWPAPGVQLLTLDTQTAAVVAACCHPHLAKHSGLSHREPKKGSADFQPSLF